VTLADLIDLEAQLARDRDASPEALAARDRALLRVAGPATSRASGAAGPPVRDEGAPAPEGGPAAAAAPSRAALLARWLDALRAAEPGALFPGHAVARTLALVRLALAALGLALGWGTAAALVTFTGGHPVNVWDVLLVLVLVQVLLLVFLAIAAALPARTLGAPLLGVTRDAVAGLVSRLARGRGARADEWRALWHRLRGRRSLYHRVEPWLLLGTTQGFGVAFNVGALLALLRAVVFSDVAFGWGTTLVELDAARFHALASTLAAPWGWLWPDAVPSVTLVEATRYSRLEAAYLGAGAGRAADPALVGGWWPFLFAAIACYGLLPRAAALTLARLRARHLLSRLPLDDAEVSRAVRRLAEPHVDTRSATPEPPRARPGPDVAAPLARAGGGARAALVLWRDVPGGTELAGAVARHVGREVAWVRAAGGRDETAGEPGGAELAAALDGAGGSPDPVVVVAEGFEAPDRAALRLVRTLREAAGPRREIRVLVVDVDGGRVRGAGDAAVRVWRDGLARLEDPFLLVEPLAEAP
jgi:hypothetical protein